MVLPGYKSFRNSVALRKESVDRNFNAMQIVIVVMQSLSARRAWIEIRQVCLICRVDFVALRKESVDRNNTVLASSRACITSLSARRAWIEIEDTSGATYRILVALRKESVDRNTLFLSFRAAVGCRSPQGERG